VINSGTRHIRTNRNHSAAIASSRHAGEANACGATAAAVHHNAARTDITLVGADPSYFAITKFSIEQSDGVTAISEDLRDDTLKTFGIQNGIR